MPDRLRVAVEADGEAREHVVRALGADVDVVPGARADVVVRVAATASGVHDALARGFAAPTILLVREPRADVVLAAVRGGAAAVLPQPPDPAELNAAIAAVAAGLIVVDASVREDAQPVRDARGFDAVAEPLTERERQVLAILAGGRSNRGIAEALGISENTVKAHVAAILAKLGVTTRTEAVTAGIRRGLLML